MAPRFGALGIAVSDLADSIAFYAMLGLEFSEPVDGGHVEANLPGGLRLMLDTEAIMEAFDPTWNGSSERGRIGLAFGCENPAEVDDTHRRLIQAGYGSHLGPFDAFWGQRYASVLDPDGNVIDLYAALPDHEASPD